MAKKKTDEVEVEQTTEATETPAEETSIVDTVLEAAEQTLTTVAETIGTVAADVVSAVTTATPAAAKPKTHKRAEKVGIVASDKMTKTVTVRVDRVVKHPVYRKYVKKRKKFMAHDDLGAKIGDKVKIVETRPLSARKRWRVVEIIQRAEV
jgi:small subunit ribosomal protein S17